VNTAGGNDIGGLLHKTMEAKSDKVPARDPSVRDVLARLDEIEEKIDALLTRRVRGPLAPHPEQWP
jgi:hypothetical protein